MARINVKSVSDYIAGQPKPAQPALRKVRAAIRKAVPGVTETISYGMATFRIPEGVVLNLAAWKEHYSLYPAGDAMMKAFKGALDDHRASKATLRFDLAAEVPATLIGRIAKFRAREMIRKHKAK